MAPNAQAETERMSDTSGNDYNMAKTTVNGRTLEYHVNTDDSIVADARRALAYDDGVERCDVVTGDITLWFDRDGQTVFREKDGYTITKVFAFEETGNVAVVYTEDS